MTKVKLEYIGCNLFLLSIEDGGLVSEKTFTKSELKKIIKLGSEILTNL